MRFRYLAAGLRNSLLLIAMAGLVAACGSKTEEPAAESAEAVSQPAAGTDRGVAYVSNQKGGITVIDLNTMETVREIDSKGGTPRGIGITADGKTLVVANKDEGNISIINTETGELIRHVEIGVNPEFVRVVGQTAFVSFEP
ncbi:MAG TPA: cytochrome D1 domain-containing protein, partial [Methylophilaceae bacterium]